MTVGESGTAKTGTRAERTLPGLHAALVDQLPENLPLDAPILDLGCGTGAWLDRLAARGYRNLHGADHDVDQAATSAARIHRIDLESPDWGRDIGPFALVTAIEVIEHIENRGTFLGNLASVLARDGRAILTTPNLHSLPARLGSLVRDRLRHFEETGDPTHVAPVFMPLLLRSAHRHGLEITRSWDYPRTGGVLTAHGAAKALCGLLGRVLPEPHRGELICFEMRRREPI